MAILTHTFFLSLLLLHLSFFSTLEPYDAIRLSFNTNPRRKLLVAANYFESKYQSSTEKVLPHIKQVYREQHKAYDLSYALV